MQSWLMSLVEAISNGFRPLLLALLTQIVVFPLTCYRLRPRQPDPRSQQNLQK